MSTTRICIRLGILCAHLAIALQLLPVQHTPLAEPCGTNAYVKVYSMSSGVTKCFYEARVSREGYVIPASRLPSWQPATPSAKVGQSTAAGSGPKSTSKQSAQVDSVRKASLRYGSKAVAGRTTQY